VIYSIIIPVHNEGATVEASVTQLLCDLAASNIPARFEVLLVENGSTDGTLDRCRHLASIAPGVRAIAVDRPSYGEAIKRGMLESQGQYLSILECDLLDATFIERSFALFTEDDAEFIVASKRHPASRDRRPRKRRMLTWAFNGLLRVSLGYPGSDTHGLKSIDAGLARELCAHAQTTDEVFQTEIVLLAWRLGVRVHELPVTIEERRAPPVSIRRRLPKVLFMIRELERSLSRFPGGPRDGVPPVTVTRVPAIVALTRIAPPSEAVPSASALPPPPARRHFNEATT